MLLVQTEWSQRPDGLGIDCVRIAGEDANTYAVAVSVATLDVGEVRGLVDGDGVYGCTSSDSAKKGGRAPRKQF